MRLLLAFLLSSCLLTSAAELLTLTNSEGKTIKAELTNVDSEARVTLKLQNGKRFTIPHTKLAPESLSTISKEWIKVRNGMVSPINEAVGHNLFGPLGDIFKEPVEKVAERLLWPKESKTPYSSSYRRYTGESYSFLGARPYSGVAYGGSDGKTQQLSLVFANKGDTLSTSGSGEDHFDNKGEAMKGSSFRKALNHDEEMISKNLTDLFGEGTTQRFGEGANRRKVTRWDWNDHSFLLTAISGEYVGLQIVPPSFADEKGKTEKVKDKTLRERLEKDVIRKENGDVYIDNIPMVDQGPKGYCAPATFERAMRHVSVPADMYLLATIATSAGGGTNTSRLFDEVRSSTIRKGRRSRDLGPGDIQLKKLKKYIDKGIPVMWQMRSVDFYNEIANSRTRRRKSVEDWDHWKNEIEEEAKDNSTQLDEENSHHICMIIGYNEQTRELAVSDSWGDRYKIRWVHESEAEAVTYAGGFVIDL